MKNQDVDRGSLLCEMESNVQIFLLKLSKLKLPTSLTDGLKCAVKSLQAA